jgi:cytochrome c-type biogenesis protein CcmH
MRSWIWPLAAGALLATAALVALTSLQPSAPSTPGGQAAALAAELRCPDCQGLSVAESRTAAAQAIRAEITAELAAGRSPDAVRQSFVDRYGDWILLRPRAPLAWIVPLALIAAGLGGVLAWILRRRTAPLAIAPPPDPELRRRVEEEAEALDA